MHGTELQHKLFLQLDVNQAHPRKKIPLARIKPFIYTEWRGDKTLSVRSGGKHRCLRHKYKSKSIDAMQLLRSKTEVGTRTKTTSGDYLETMHNLSCYYYALTF